MSTYDRNLEILGTIQRHRNYRTCYRNLVKGLENIGYKTKKFMEVFKTDFKFIGKVGSQTYNFLKSSILAHFT